MTEPQEIPQDAPQDLPAVPVTRETTPQPAAPAVKKSIAGSTWVALIVGALILINLLVFILQNLQPAVIHIFGWQFTVPIGIAVLFGAILGALIMALVGGVRMFQLRRQVKN